MIKFKAKSICLLFMIIMLGQVSVFAYDIDQTPEMKLKAEKSLEGAWQYFNGVDVEQSYDEAFKGFKNSAELGNARAALHLSGLYSDKSEYKKSRHWRDIAFHRFRRDVLVGDGFAAKEIAFSYFNDKSVTNYRDIAAKLFLKAGKLGNGKALLMYADYVLGAYGDYEPDYDEHFKAIKMAAQTELVVAEYILGASYMQGDLRLLDKIENVQNDPYKDFDKAYYWLNKTAEKGYVLAHFKLAFGIYLVDPKRKNRLKSMMHLILYFKLMDKQPDLSNLPFNPNKEELNTAHEMAKNWILERSHIEKHIQKCKKIEQLMNKLSSNKNHGSNMLFMHISSGSDMGCWW